MQRIVLRIVAAVMIAGLASAPVIAQPGPGAPQRQAVMPSFASEDALWAFLDLEDDADEDYSEEALEFAYAPPPPAPPPPPPPPPAVGSPSAAPSGQVVVTGSRVTPSAPDNPNITNNQIEGVDEGGIVKVSGDYLIILRRGRLFSVSTRGGTLTAIDSIEAYPPGVNARSDWYDEMLVSGDMVAVIGFSYRRGGTEVNRFRLSRDGRFTFIDAYHLRSNDYYSSENYATRLVGNRLIVYAPLDVRGRNNTLPAMSRWQADRQRPDFQTIVRPSRIFAPTPLMEDPTSFYAVLHTVMRCDLTARRMTCDSTVVLGTSSRDFFVSQNAVYVWTGVTRGTPIEESSAYLYRIPFDAGDPLAARVRGSTINQFSFSPNAEAGRLDVFVTSEGHGSGMWASEFARGTPALLRLPMSRFGDGSALPVFEDYQVLPARRNGNFSDPRFVNGWLLYAASFTAREGGSGYELTAVPVAGGEPVQFPYTERITRIDQLGMDAIVVSGRGRVVFDTVELSGSAAPRLASQYVEPDAREGESRSHAFFYRPDRDARDAESGIIGLPVMVQGQRSADNRFGFGSADMLFLRRENRELSEFGRLSATRGGRPDDGCVASCVDWYGNARPIFLGERIFALMGYELIEGSASGAAIREVGRVNFSPASGSVAKPVTSQ